MASDHDMKHATLPGDNISKATSLSHCKHLDQDQHCCPVSSSFSNSNGQKLVRNKAENIQSPKITIISLNTCVDEHVELHPFKNSSESNKNCLQLNEKVTSQMI